MTQIRNALLILKQYGFSDKSLEEVYKYETFESFVNPLFFKDHVSYGRYDSILTDKEKDLTKDYTEFLRFIELFKAKMSYYKSLGVKIYFKYDADFPGYLFPSKNKPLFIYCYGNKELLNESNQRIAIIGTRNASPYGLSKTHKYVREYVNKGYITISGLAKGIDTAVHKETLNYGGRTVAVLPTSFEKIYPKENEKLFRRIVNSGKGLAITKVGPFENTYKSNFLERNSIIAKMSTKILLIEADLKSGTLNTVNRASEFKKEILYDSSLLTSEVIMHLSKLDAKDIQGGK